MTCPIDGTFEFCTIQIPTSSLTLPGRGVVGHNNDRYINNKVYAVYLENNEFGKLGCNARRRIFKLANRVILRLPNVPHMYMVCWWFLSYV